MDRRKFLAGAAGLGIASLAGCSAEPAERSQELKRPEPPSDPDNEYWQFVIDSLDYQNRMLERME